MNDDLPVTLQAKLLALKGPYLEQLRTRTDSLVQFVSLMEQSAFGASDHAELQFLAHKLAGTGATYGFASISETGRALEKCMQQNPANTPEILQLTRGLIAACQAALRS